jgi:hypothetical protein
VSRPERAALEAPPPPSGSTGRSHPEPSETPALTKDEPSGQHGDGAARLLLRLDAVPMQKPFGPSCLGDNGAVAWYPGATYERTCQRERRSSVNPKDEHDHRPGELLAVDLHPIGVSPLGAEALGDAQCGCCQARAVVGLAPSQIESLRITALTRSLTRTLQAPGFPCWRRAGALCAARRGVSPHLSEYAQADQHRRSVLAGTGSASLVEGVDVTSCWRWNSG